MSDLIKRKILSATLKAETVRIRMLRAEAEKHLRCARSTDDDVREEGHRILWRDFKEAAVCPSARARAANLTLGFLKGRPYRQIEYKTRMTTKQLLTVVAPEVSRKAGVPYDTIVAWMQVPATEKMDAAFVANKEAARKRKEAAKKRRVNGIHAPAAAAAPA
jgi:hypothetical protein